jgi:hypothetical protein
LIATSSREAMRHPVDTRIRMTLYVRVSSIKSVEPVKLG